jgi:uncharacterized protein (TIGR03435 family)
MPKWVRCGRGYSLLVSIAVLLAGVLAGGEGTGQQAQRAAQPQALPSFEVASIKLNPEIISTQSAADRERGWGDVTGRVNLLAIPLRKVILRAFGIEGIQLVAPEWVNTACYDILAIVPPGTPKEQIPLMFQSLLAERLHMTFHSETEPISVFALVVAKGGPKLNAALAPDAPNRLEGVPPLTYRSGRPVMSGAVPGKDGFSYSVMDYSTNILHVEYPRMSLDDFVTRLNRTEVHSGHLALPVVNRTGLDGLYQITVETYMGLATWPPDDTGDSALPTPPSAGAGPFLESLARQGLHLERRTAPMKRVFIDSIEKLPSEN